MTASGADCGGDMTPDPRLVEVVAAALCWAEFRVPACRSDDPMTYWRGISEDARAGYRKSAELLALFITGSANLAIVPKELSPATLHAAKCCVRASDANVKQAWSLMLTEAWLAQGSAIRGVDEKDARSALALPMRGGR